MTRCECDYYELHHEHWGASYADVVCKPLTPAPWSDVLKCAVTNDKTAYRAYWPKFESLRSCCITALVADFYLYELIKFKSGYKQAEGTQLFQHFIECGFRPNDSYLIGKQAEITLANLVARWAAPLKEYLHYATVAELTHCMPFVQSFGDDPICSFYGWGKLAKAVGKVQAVDYASQLFQLNWPRAFGGYKWRTITQILKYGEQGHVDGYEFSDALFLDRIFSLQHNTGVVFSKFRDWNMKLYYKTDDPIKNPHAISKLYKVLDAHHIGDVDGLLEHASPESVNLYKRGFHDSD